MTITIQDLFTPAQSGVGLNPNLPAPEGTWLAELIAVAAAVGLPTTSWQPGGPERTILAIAAVALAQEDALISLMAQGGFLDFAASGTVSTTSLDGTVIVKPVTPDPSIPSQNPDGTPGWLDALGESFYDVARLQATYARGTLSILNTGNSTLNYGVALYHAANSATGAAYSNVESISIPPSLVTGAAGTVTGVIPGTTTTIQTQNAHGLSVGDVVVVLGLVGISGVNSAFVSITNIPNSTTFQFQLAAASTGAWTSGGRVYLCTNALFQADILGVASNAAPGAVTVAISANVGVSVSNLTAWSAANYESNVSYANRCRLKLGALSPNGPSQAYIYFALTAEALLAAESPPIVMTNGPIVNAISYATPSTGVVTTVVQSATPASSTLGDPVTPGCAQLGVSNATNTSPIEITTISNHGLETGWVATVSGVLGNTAANTTATITVTGPDTFTLDDVAGTGAYTGGGIVEGGDLGQVDRLIQANVVPSGITALTVSALAFPITIVAVVVVPQAYVTLYQGLAPIALAAYIATLPIGGNIAPGEVIGQVPYSAVSGALITAGVLPATATSFVREVTTLTVNGGTVDVSYPTPNHVAILITPNITVVGV